jgi:hypothetical protein
MAKTWAIIGMLGILGAMWAAVYYVSSHTEFGRIDYCLDSGGAWDYELKKCKGARPGYDGP